MLLRNDNESRDLVYLHPNAKLIFHGRVQAVSRVKDQHWTITAASEAAGCSTKTGGKWMTRFRTEGYRGLQDRSCAPKVTANKTPKEREEEVCFLRRTCKMD